MDASLSLATTKSSSMAHVAALLVVGIRMYETASSCGRCAVTYVTRTLVGEPGTTYKYLGLR